MALPANTTTVTVVGKYLDPDGQPSTGTITFTPSQWLQNAADDIVIPAATITKTLGTAGDFSVVLPVTDDPDLSPSNWVWDITEAVDSISRRYSIVLPGSVATNGTVQLADVVPAVPAGPSYYSLVSSLSIGTVTTLAAGSAATADITGLAPNQVLDLGIPQGAAATIEVGTVASGTAGGTPTVTNSGTTGSAVLDFVLVPGNTGPQGEKGDTGATGTAATIEIGTVTTGAPGSSATVTNSGSSSAAILDFSIPEGVAATIEIGTVTSVPDGGTASVTNSGTSGSAVLDFVLVDGPVDTSSVPKSVFTDKGSLVAASGSATPADLPVGSDGQVLVADSGETVGVKWGEPWDSAGFIIGQQVFS